MVLCFSSSGAIVFWVILEENFICWIKPFLHTKPIASIAFTRDMVVDSFPTTGVANSNYPNQVFPEKLQHTWHVKQVINWLPVIPQCIDFLQWGFHRLGNQCLAEMK